jgi:hypothetical protein
MAIIETREASRTAAALRRFYDGSRKSNFTERPPLPSLIPKNGVSPPFSKSLWPFSYSPDPADGLPAITG